MRAQSDAVMTGIGTVLADDPLLTVRKGRRAGARGPMRVVVDTKGRTPTRARIVTEGGARTVIASTAAAPASRRRALEAAGAEVWLLPERDGRVDLTALLQRLADAGVHWVLAESGPTLNASLIQWGLVDCVALFVAPKILGDAAALPFSSGAGPERMAGALALRNVRWRRIGDDMLCEGTLE
jgi:diaminohydroxyphosphoribosylaminopyrimidine deaminase/5-amino-6-(5-phosphoribosylamino)uracil reductase